MKISVKITALLVMAVVTALLGAALHFANDMRSALFDREVQSLKEQLAFRTQIFTRGMSQMQRHARLFTQNSLTRQWLEDPKPESREASYLASTFKQLLEEYPEYFQARLISVDGREQLRIERTQAGVRQLDSTELQDKSSRYYVIEGLKLSQGDVYYSPIDLNREHGAIEVPQIPTVRAAAPVYSLGGKLLGLFVLNVNVAEIIRRAVAADYARTTYICNEEGYFIAHPRAEYTFGFEFGNDYRLQTLLPSVAKAMQTDGQDFSQVTAEFDDSIAFAREINYGSGTNRYTLLFIQTVPENIIQARVIDSARRYIPSALLLLVVGTVVSVMLSRYLSRRLVTLKVSADSIAKGSRKLTLPKKHNDEIDEVFTTFDHMLSEIERSEERIRQDQNKLRAILDTVLNGVITINHKGEINDINQFGAEIFGYKPVELKGKNIKVLMPHHEALQHDAYLANYVRDGKKHIISQQRDLEGLRKDGTKFPILLAVSELEFEGQFLFVGAIVDISDRKQFESSLREINAELVKKNRDLENFVYVASHDLQEPIRKVISFANILTETEADHFSEYGRDILARCSAAALRMQQMIKSVLSLSHITKSEEKPSLIPLRQLVIAITEEITAQHSEVVFRVSELPQLCGVEMYIQQLLTNLLNNAVKFHRPGVTPVVTVTSLDKPPADADRHAADLVYFAVEDNGIGIDEAYKEKIFSPFVRLHTHEEYAGTGIGLAICQKVVEVHNGYISVEKGTTGGCRFVVGLPGASTYERKY